MPEPGTTGAVVLTIGAFLVAWIGTGELVAWLKRRNTRQKDAGPPSDDDYIVKVVDMPPAFEGSIADRPIPTDVATVRIIRSLAERGEATDLRIMIEAMEAATAGETVILTGYITQNQILDIAARVDASISDLPPEMREQVHQGVVEAVTAVLTEARQLPT